jgi:hypothetical protein
MTLKWTNAKQHQERFFRFTHIRKNIWRLECNVQHTFPTTVYQCWNTTPAFVYKCRQMFCKCSKPLIVHYFQHPMVVSRRIRPWHITTFCSVVRLFLSWWHIVKTYENAHEVYSFTELFRLRGSHYVLFWLFCLLIVQVSKNKSVLETRMHVLSHILHLHDQMKCWRSFWASFSHARALAACFPHIGEVWITTNQLARFHNKEHDEIFCKLKSTENLRPFEQY